MPCYIVHIYREMLLTYGTIEAETPHEAAMNARDLPTRDADDITDCDGATLAALVDVRGDEGFDQSRLIEFAIVKPCSIEVPSDCEAHRG